MAKNKSIELFAKIEGLKELQNKIKKLHPEYAKAWRKALWHAGMFLKGEAQRRTPVDTGALRNSAQYRTLGSGWNSIGEVSYHTIYAVAVHEVHPTKSKFLESAYRENRNEIFHRLSTALQQYTP